MLAPLICLRLNRLPNLLMLGSTLAGIAMMLVAPSANAEESQGIMNYRGLPTGIALSADGRSVAIASKTIAYGSGDDFRFGSGIAVVDVESGRIRLLRDYPFDEIGKMAFSFDGQYLAAVRTVMQDGRSSEVVSQLPLDASLRSSALKDLVSSDLHGDVTAISYDRGSLERVLVFSELGSGRGGIVFQPPTGFSLESIDFGGGSGAVTPLENWMATSITRSGSDWISADFFGTGPAWIASDQSVHMLGGQSRDIEATFVVGKQINMGPFHVNNMPGRPNYFGQAPDDLRYMIGVVDRSLSGGPQYQNLYLYKRDGSDSYPAMLLAHGDGGILFTAVSGDGHRIAFISIPLEDSDPQPVLKLVDLPADDSPSVHETDILAKVGLGRTLVHGRMSAPELLQRLKIFFEQPLALNDPKFIERTLGVKLEKLQSSDGVFGRYTINDDTSGTLNRSTYDRDSSGSDLTLNLDGGPCLTESDIEENFGDQFEADNSVIDFFQTLPKTVDKYGLIYRKTGYMIYFSLEYLSRTQSVSIKSWRE